MSHHLTILDGQALNPGDLSWKAIFELVPTQLYDRTPPDQIISRAKESDILIINKTVLSRTVLLELPKLKYICVSATGYNNVDLDTAREQGIWVSNVAGYSTHSVAQQVFAFLLHHTNQTEAHINSVRQGGWTRHPDFAYWLHPIPELHGQTLGIFGFGKIGQAVANIALAFGMEVLATHRHPERDAMPGVTFVPLEELFERSNFVSLHVPLNDSTSRIVNRHLLQRMPPRAVLINTGRGPLINDHDLLTALDQAWLEAAYLDVLDQEPPPADHPLLQHPNCHITPHLAWGSIQARQTLMREVIENVKAFLNGELRNGVC